MSKPRGSRRSVLLAPVPFLLLAVLTAAFYWKVIAGGGIFVFVDASRFFYPLWKWGSEALGQGLIPLWNPDAQFGTPYLADPQMAYAYPPLPLLYFWFTPINAFAAVTIFHHFWALAGFWVFARAQGFSTKVSFLGSLIFGFSLHLVCSSWTPVALMTISWLPWIFWAAEKVYQRERGGVLYLSFAWAMQLAAGYPVLTYLTGLAVLLHYGWKTLQPLEDFSMQKANWVISMAAAVLTAAVYNLVWGLPFAEFFSHSNYQNGASRFQDLSWTDLATALNPFVLGHPLGHDYGGPHYWVSTYFLGLPTLCLILWGLRRSVYRKGSVPVFFILIVLSLGSTLGLGSFLKGWLPGYALVIHSGFWISLVAFWAAWLAMESMEAFFLLKKDGKEGIIWIGIVLLVYGFSLGVKTPFFPAAFWISFFLLCLAAFFSSSQARGFLLAGALGFSLGTAAYSLNILLDKSYYETPSFLLSRLDEPGRLFFSPPLLRDASRLEGSSMEEAYETAKQKLYPNWPLTFKREETPIYNTLQLSDSFAWTFRAFQRSLSHSRRVLDFLNVRYVFGKNLFKGFKTISNESDPVQVSENPSALPKWFSVVKADHAGDSIEDDFLKADKLSIDYSKECFVDDPAKAGNYKPRRIEETFRGINRLSLSAAGSGQALLISSETQYPGWRVMVEGKLRPIERVNHAFRGVIVNEGESHVEFNYTPTTFRLGLFFSLLVLGLWTTMGFQRLKP